MRGTYVVLVLMAACVEASPCEAEPFDLNTSFAQSEYERWTADAGLSEPTCDDVCQWKVFEGSYETVVDLTSCEHTVPIVDSDGAPVSGTVRCAGMARPGCD